MNERGTPKNIKDYSYDKFVEMLNRWVRDPLSEPELEKWYVEGAPYDIPFCKREPEQWEKEHKQYSPIYQLALALEKTGDYAKAVSLYMQILNKHIPHGTAYYERPAIILEKMAKYKEAVVICNLAISAIENRLFNADIEPFVKRRTRLEKKIKNKQEF